MQNYMKTIASVLKAWTKKEIKENAANWDQNDPNGAGYIKNRTHWEVLEKKIWVDNLTSQEYDKGNIPKCNFVPGNSYNVIFNDVLYENLVCYFDDGWNIVASPDNGYPFYIDDDGGDAFYISSDIVPFTVTVYECVNTIHKLDPKYLPDDIGGRPDWSENDENAPGYIANRTHYVGPIGTIIEAEAWPTFHYPDYGDPYTDRIYCPLIKGKKYIINAGPVTLYSNAIYDDEDGPWSQLFRTAEDADNNMNAIGSFHSSWEDEASVSFWIDSGATDIVSQLQGAQHKVTVSREDHIIKQLDEEFLPDSVRRATTEVDKKLNSKNPEGTGYIAMNDYYESSGIGDYSSIFGADNVATKRSQHVVGEYSKTDPTTYAVKISEVVERTFNYYYSAMVADAYTFDPHTGYFTLINPTRTTFGSIANRSNVYFIGNSSASTLALFYKVDDYSRAKGTDIYYNIQELNKEKTPKDERGEYVHVVGNGVAYNARSNAHTLDWEGNAWYQGDVYVGSTSGTDRDEGSKKLATEEYVQEAVENVGAGSGGIAGLEDLMVINLEMTNDGEYYKNLTNPNEVFDALNNGVPVILRDGSGLYTLWSLDGDSAKFGGLYYGWDGKLGYNLYGIESNGGVGKICITI